MRGPAISITIPIAEFYLLCQSVCSIPDKVAHLVFAFYDITVISSFVVAKYFYQLKQINILFSRTFFNVLVVNPQINKKAPAHIFVNVCCQSGGQYSEFFLNVIWRQGVCSYYKFIQYSHKTYKIPQFIGTFSYLVCYVFYCMFLCIEIPLNTEVLHVEHQNSCVTLS